MYDIYLDDKNLDQNDNRKLAAVDDQSLGMSAVQLGPGTFLVQILKLVEQIRSLSKLADKAVAKKAFWRPARRLM